jgi:hypothetical protein
MMHLHEKPGIHHVRQAMGRPPGQPDRTRLAGGSLQSILRRLGSEEVFLIGADQAASLPTGLRANPRPTSPADAMPSISAAADPAKMPRGMPWSRMAPNTGAATAKPMSSPEYTVP